MRWYHFTGFGNFVKILQAERLVSLNQLFRESYARDYTPEEAQRLIASLDAERLSNPRDYRRLNHVFFAPDTGDRWSGSQSRSVMLGLELPNEANEGILLLLPQAGLEHLVEVGAEPSRIEAVKSKLATEHGGKYRHIKVYEI